eukprot:gene1403-5420_t
MVLPAQWSGLPPGVAGTTWGGLIHACDWLPTVVAALTGAPPAAGETLPLDGVDQWAALTGAG